MHEMRGMVKKKKKASKFRGKKAKYPGKMSSGSLVLFMYIHTHTCITAPLLYL